jgi:hypothetical protein
MFNYPYPVPVRPTDATQHTIPGSETIHYDSFEPYTKVIAIQSPCVYDQCKIDKCLYHPDFPVPPPDPSGANGEPDEQLIQYFSNFGDPITGGTFELLDIRDKKIKILSMSMADAACHHKPSAKNITVNYEISFWADVKTSETNYPIRSLKFTLLKTDSALLNCPDPKASITAACSSEGITSPCLDELTVKLELLLEQRGVRFKKVELPDGQGGTYEDYAVEIAICYALLFKSQLNVQLLVPTYGFYEDTYECQQPSSTCPCESYTPIADDYYPDIDFDAFVPPPPEP